MSTRPERVVEVAVASLYQYPIDEVWSSGSMRINSSVEAAPLHRIPTQTITVTNITRNTVDFSTKHLYSPDQLTSTTTNCPIVLLPPSQVSRLSWPWFTVKRDTLIRHGRCVTAINSEEIGGEKKYDYQTDFVILTAESFLIKTKFSSTLLSFSLSFISFA